jgi:hypothetical protein
MSLTVVEFVPSVPHAVQLLPDDLLVYIARRYKRLAQGLVVLVFAGPRRYRIH